MIKASKQNAKKYSYNDKTRFTQSNFTARKRSRINYFKKTNKNTDKCH